MLNQFAFSPVDPGTSITATATLVAEAPGTLVMYVGCTGSPFCQFGAGPTAPDTTSTPTVTLVPEPMAAALLGVGLLGLAAARRDRYST